ncbi:Gfo/Idh/MocA family oxidoreductase [Deferribacter thermophilus]|uniref:Gfo/Idh/MocA family protein n=1 Tax=Deferribacter thermophilus TaxID=53573 RepID=UPI003C282128
MIKMGLIGLGRMGKYHLNLYDEIPEVKLMGICDINEEELNKQSKLTGVRGYLDYREMLDTVEAVTIAVPTKYHYEVAKECLLAGKHVLVEKPITTNLEQAKELFDIAMKKDLVLNIGHVERFNGAVMELKKIVNNPYLIESRRVGPFAERMKNDSIILDLMIHDIDIILNILEDEVVDIQAQGASVYSKLVDYASVNLKFKKGTVANIIVSRVNQKKDRTMSIAQKDAFIFLDYTNQDINIYRQGTSQHIFGNKELTYKNEYILERLFVYKDNPLKLEIKNFIKCIDNRACRVVSVEHELKSLEVALKIDEMLNNR